MNDRSHPTIKDIYRKVHSLEPSIGQATIYRHINKLVESENIRKISIDNEIDHYDGNLSDHCHFVCTTCNKIIDVFDVNIDINKKKTNKNYDILIDKIDILLYGKCKECNH